MRDSDYWRMNGQIDQLQKRCRELVAENGQLREIVAAALAYVQKGLPGDYDRLCVLLDEPCLLDREDAS